MLSMPGAASRTMNPPPSTDLDRETIQRASDVVEFLAKTGGSLALIWAFIAKVWKPYQEWRRRNMTMLMREVLKNELAQLSSLISREEGCADKIEGLVGQISELFTEHDLLLDVVYDNRDRIDETNDLLDAVGLANERRVPPKEEVVKMLSQLDERRKLRRRHLSRPANADASN